MPTHPTPQDDRGNKLKANHSRPNVNLQEAVANLGKLSQPLYEVSEQFILAFNHNQFEAIDALWQNHGLDLVVSRYAHLQRYHISKIENLPQLPDDKEDKLSPVRYDIPKHLHLLQILKYEPASTLDSKQSEYFRASNIEIDPQTEQDTLNILTRSQLIELIVPELDEIQQTQLRGNDIQGIQVAVHWYGQENFYGDGSVLRLSLKVSRPERSTIDARLFVTEQGSTGVCLYDPELAETGYEGHQFRNVSLCPEQTEVLTTLIEKLSKSGSVKNKPYYMGAWL